MRTDKVWLTGEKFDVAYLLDLDNKSVRRYVQRGTDVGPTAGFMEKTTGGRQVGWYVSPADSKLHVRLGDQDFGVQQVVASSLSRGPCGLSTRLDLTIDRIGTEVLRRLTPARAVLRRVDPAYDDLDEYVDDFLAQLGEVVSSSGAQERILKSTDPGAGPWHLLDG